MNPMDIFKNFKNIQSRVNEIQDKLQHVKVTGFAGGDMVKVDMNGQMTVTKVTISPDAVNPNDIGMLEDLVLAAITDASVKIKESIRQEMSSLTGGMDLPPGFMGM